MDPDQRAATELAPRKKSWGALLGFGLATAVVAGLGTVATEGTVRSLWYKRLRQPPFQPPNELFAPVWTGLYALMAASAWRVWRAPPSPERTRALALWGTQLGLNGAWSPLFFGARKPSLALVDMGALYVAIAAYVNEARKVDKAAAWMMAPYVGWTTFAAALNEEIVRLNA